MPTLSTPRKPKKPAYRLAINRRKLSLGKLPQVKCFRSRTGTSGTAKSPEVKPVSTVKTTGVYAVA